MKIGLLSKSSIMEREIDKETLPKVAKSGFTTKEKGGGNGLHAVGNYINAIHGEFDVKNRSDGSGVVVTLAIPLK